MAQRPGKQSERQVDRPRESAGQESGGTLGGALPDLMRKAFAMGFSGFFFTEEVIRKALGETLPRDWADFASEQSERARAEFLERLSYEIGRAMENVDYAAVLSQLLEGHTLAQALARSGQLDEAIEIGRKFSGDEAGRFLNGVLDAISKAITSGKPPNSEQPSESASKSTAL